MPHTRLATALLAALSLAACDTPSEPEPQVQEQLAFVRHRDLGYRGIEDSTDIWRVNADGSGLVNLTNHPAHYRGLTPSPDGSSILFESNRGGWSTHLWIIGRDGSGLRQLTSDDAVTPRWSPDGSRIAAVMAPMQDPEHVYVLNANGTGTPLKVSGPAMEVGASCSANPDDRRSRIELVDWLPDGRIAFARYYCGFGYRFFIVNADGSGFQQTEIRLNAVHWSPDGTRIAYDASGSRVMMRNMDGSGDHVVVAQELRQGLPTYDKNRFSAWTPDGGRLMFFAGGTRPATPSSCFDGALPYVVNADGTGLRQVLETCNGTFSGWSRSGDKLAFHLWADAGEPNAPEVWVVNADGTGLVNVTNSPYWEKEATWLPPL